MPFTVSHAAAVLPFRRLNLVWSAFIIGSMAPDFPYVVGTTEYRDVGHTLPGLLTFTIPASLMGLWMFHNLIKGPVAGLLPVGVQVRLRDQLRPFSFAGLRRFLTILASVVLGIASHLVWDSFTHSRTWAYHHVRWLRGWVHVPFIGIMPVHSAMQYGSSVVGLLALAIWVCLWYRKAPVTEGARLRRPTSRFSLAITMLIIAGVAGALRALLLVGPPAIRANAHSFLLVFGVTSLALAFWQVLFYCVLVSTYQVW